MSSSNIKSYGRSGRYSEYDDKRGHHSSRRDQDYEYHRKKDAKDSHRDRKHKKKHKRKSSSKGSSSDSDDGELNVKLLQKLEYEQEKQKLIAASKKEKLKALETPEEKRLRRLLKKEQKERKRKEKMGWDSEYLHFTNEDNPYGDNNLLDTFVWKKKLDKSGLANLSREEIQKRSREKMEENKYELEKVKKRRLEREQERAERDRLTELQQREKEAAQFSAFSKQEDVFQLEQARIRSQIRIQDERAKPIDLLAQYVSSEGDVSAVDMHEPYTHLTGLTLGDLEDLIEDIKVYQQLEKVDENQIYWTDLTTIVQDELRRLRQRDATAIEDATTNRAGIHASIAEDVSKIFINKTVSQLQELQATIESKLAGPTKGIDVGYWESLLSQLKAHQARARLRERHKINLKKKLEMLKAEQGVKEEFVEPAIVSESECTREEKPEIEEPNCEELLSWAITAYNNGRFSPKLFTAEDLEPGIVIVDEKEEQQRLLYAREKVTMKHQKIENILTAEEKAMHREAQKAMTSDEAQFSVEAHLDSKPYLWSDKYRPRKPRYFNRVHTGFEWNKYNQTHYDMDNPPPKIVQGYKFNIFYPDLIDKNSTPEYDLVPIPGNKDFALLKFTAGPPYEDIGFKIVNREWEYSYKRGFRCQFHNNIFQLWFHFKRYRYRR